jgi:hypothetical protein
MKKCPSPSVAKSEQNYHRLSNWISSIQLIIWLIVWTFIYGCMNSLCLPPSWGDFLFSPFYTFPDQMPDDARCKIFVVRGDPASLISNTCVNTVFSRWWHGQWRFLYRWTRYLPVDPRKDPGPCRRDHGAYGLSRSLHGWFTDVRGCPQINKIYLCCVDIRGHPWLTVYCPWTIRIHPCSSI